MFYQYCKQNESFTGKHFFIAVGRKFNSKTFFIFVFIFTNWMIQSAFKVCNAIQIGGFQNFGGM